ncbi:DOWNSTREAM OF FLC-like protein [Drosera capensis]
MARQMSTMMMAAAAVAVMCVASVCAARPVADPYSVEGRVYCDTCQAGFETSATTYIKGAKVRVDCTDRYTQELLYTAEGTTDSAGQFKILINEDQGDRVCDTILVSSPQSDCKLADPGRHRSRIILNSNNGMISRRRFSNSLGFVKDQPLAACAQVLLQYQLTKDDN